MVSAPYLNSMRLGQGFNTYTQEIRLESAVKITPKSPKDLRSRPQTSLNRTLSASRPHTDQLTPRTSQEGSGAIDAVSSHGQPLVSDEQAARASTDFRNASVARGASAAALAPKTIAGVAPFTIHEPVTNAAQSVTFSTRAIDNLSDIMDALNVSAATSIKYGTIHGNASAAFVNEGKVLDSQLNYVVSVKVNNIDGSEDVDMEFQPIDDLPPDRFTEVYGDSFISGFLTGGEFNAVISIDVHDKSKLTQVKQSVDVQLAVGPSPLAVGARESISSSHSKILEGTEITISVNWTGGGEIKNPEVPWTLENVVAVANAFPSMVAGCSVRTTAVLTQYTQLKSFQAWRWKRAAGDENSEWLTNQLILNYAPCSVYTADLFDALCVYKNIWKKIGFILSDTSKWRERESVDIPNAAIPRRQSVSKVDRRSSIAQNNHITYGDLKKDLHLDTNHTPLSATIKRMSRIETYQVDDPDILPEWALDVLNAERTPIKLDPYSLNEARLACREAMTLITEEAARLVNHPELAYAYFDSKTKMTKMKRPVYAYPETLRARLPVFIRPPPLTRWQKFRAHFRHNQVKSSA